MPSFRLSVAVCLGLSLSLLLASQQSFSAETPAKAGEVAEPNASSATESFTEQDLEFFEKQVRPILVARCYECHRSGLEEPKGGLRLDARSAVLAGGDTGPAVIAGKAEESLLIDAVRYGDVYQMPPKSKMPADEIAVLERWVNLGLPWPKELPSPDHIADTKKFDLQARRAEHWAWQPLQHAAIPTVADKSFVASEASGANAVSAAIDQFLLAKLQTEGLRPAPLASKSQLLRRVYFDLIGLPPTASEVREYLADESPSALAKVIDRLLASPHFGERWGRHWLDLMRYAESRGHEFDYTIPNVWQYRDYVIRALNQDVPYDQFVREHMAGDLLPSPRMNSETGANESILGTGFWFLGEWVHSPVDIRKDETDRLDNMIDVATKALLGLTVSCARCHDHKFDAISQADYYALAGYLKSSSYRLVCFENRDHNRQVAEDWAALNARYAPLLAQGLIESYKPVLKSLDKYLIAAQSVLQTVPAEQAKDKTAVTDLLGTPEELRQEEAAKVAQQSGLEADVLNAWVKTLVIARSEPDHPLHAWALIATSADKLDSREKLLSVMGPQKQRLTERAAARAKALQGMRVIVDYSTAKPTEFLPDDVSFGLNPIQAGELLLGNQPAQPLAGVQSYSAAQRSAEWAVIKPAVGAENDPGRMAGWVRAGQTLRTPNFELQTGRLFYLVEGTGHIYANVNSHITNNGPLHGQLVGQFETKPGSGPVWIEQNLTAYPGHTLHVEFTATADRPCSILMVVEADRTPGQVNYAGALLEPLVSAAYDTQAEVAAAYQKLFQSLSEDVRTNQLSADAKREAKADLADWLVSQTSLFVADKNESKAKYLQLGAEYQTARQALISKIKPHSQLGMAMQEGTGQDELLLIRGNSRTPGEAVPRRFLSALAADSATTPVEGSGRLNLADQMVSPTNPLTSRVMVNRVWHHLFGRGLVASVDNFGVLGEKPTHPELLDYLAAKFVDEGWSLKKLIRTIMLTRAYQMSSQHEAAADQLDPANLLWHRANVRRLEAEALRDSLLAVSGRLDRKQFGPSVPVYLTDFLQGRGRPASGPVDGAGRRSLYISIRRNFLSPMMLAFDMPIPFNTVGKRNVSNVPAQALILMNDPLVVEQARLWARRSLAVPDQSMKQRIETMYLEAFARLPDAQELAAAEGFFKIQAEELKIPVEQVGQHEQLWTDFAHVLFNAKEFIFLH